jgi:hypothetical protein
VSRGRAQVVRMRITGHRTDSMERRYNIVNIDDIKSAREMMQKRRKDEESMPKAAHRYN